MFEGILVVIGVMLLCAVIFSPFVLWDLYKKKKRKKLGAEAPEQVTVEQKTIIWWQALLCGLVILSIFPYLLIKSEIGTILPAIIAYPYYALCIWCLVFVSKKKIVFKK